MEACLMADWETAVQSPPATPASGNAVVYVDSVSKKLSVINDAGVIDTMDTLPNGSTTSQTPFASDTYLVGSAIAIPSSAVLKVGTLYRCTFDVSKTAAGVAAAVIIVRFGTAGTTADAARLTFTFGAQSAATDTGMFDIYARFRVVGVSAVLQGRCLLTHGASITGLNNLVSQTLQVTSGAFDSTVASSIIGVSVNGGASAAWTVQLVESALENI
jgi:hypothetical protein